MSSEKQTFDFWWSVAAAAGTLSVAYLVYGYFSTPKTSLASRRVPFRRYPLGVISTEELKQMDGKEGRPLAMSICGRIFDLSSGKSWYGPEGPYNCFAASDATFMLGAMDLKKENRNKVDFGAWTRDDLSPGELAALSDEEYSHADFDEETLSGWVLKFVSKYPVIGRLEGFEHVGARFWTNIVGTTGAVVGDTHAKESPSQQVTLGEVDRSTQVSVGGWVFDVSIASWVYEPIYGDFPNAVGREISTALVTDTFTDETLDAPVSEVLKTEEEKRRLEELVRLFKATYPCVGQLKNAKDYQM